MPPRTEKSPPGDAGAQNTAPADAGEAPGLASAPGSAGSELFGAMPRADADPARERDAELAARARRGDLDAFNTLVTLYQDMLYGMALRVLADRDAAEDAVQDAFLNAYRHIAGFRGGTFRSWLARILLNAATDQLRLRRRRPSQPYPELEDETWEPPADPAAGPEETMLRRTRERALADALADLREEQRTAIVMYDVSGFDYHEIAELTGVELGTVKSRIHRGRLALRDLLADRMELFRG